MLIHICFLCSFLTTDNMLALPPHKPEVLCGIDVAGDTALVTVTGPKDNPFVWIQEYPSSDLDSLKNTLAELYSAVFILEDDAVWRKGKGETKTWK